MDTISSQTALINFKQNIITATKRHKIEYFARMDQT